jgi:amino acid transporter
VSRANLGVNASLTAASVLLVDYVFTVAVSVAAGVANIVSALPALAPYAVQICLVMVAVLALVNLRGVKESGTVFAVPTYGFAAVVFLMILWGVIRIALGDPPRAESAHFGIHATHGTTGLHNQSALRLKARLLFRPGVMVISVPWQLGSAEAALARRGDEQHALQRHARSVP